MSARPAPNYPIATRNRVEARAKALAQARRQPLPSPTQISALEHRILELEAQNERLEKVRIAELEAENEQLRNDRRKQLDGTVVLVDSIRAASARQIVALNNKVEMLEGKLKGQEQKQRISGWLDRARLMDYEPIQEMGDTTLEMGQDKEGDDDLVLGQSLSCVKPPTGRIVLDEFLRLKDEEARQISGSTTSLSIDTPLTTCSLDDPYGKLTLDKLDDDTDDSSISSPIPAASRQGRAVLQSVQSPNDSDAKGLSHDSVKSRKPIAPCEPDTAAFKHAESCMRRFPRPVKAGKKVKQATFADKVTVRLYVCADGSEAKCSGDTSSQPKGASLAGLRL